VNWEAKQGCQMANLEGLVMEKFGMYLMSIWNILRSFSIVCGRMV
jgi:hypothetical protein